MAIVNVTPDSFYSPSRINHDDLEEKIQKCLEMVFQGATILDIGGESSRPGSEYVEEAEELQRVIPLIKALRTQTDLPISVDTRKAKVAEAAFQAGANWINDISALEDDPKMASVLAETGMKIVLMHKRGTPSTMQMMVHYENVVDEVGDYLEARKELALKKGISESQILVDPGIGFAKDLKGNLALMHSLGSLKARLGPLVVGASRKRWIGEISGAPVEDRLPGSLALAIWAQSNGVDVIRVHDVAATQQALLVARAIARGDV